tara:strand:- start:356 stop:586 length:231 start_codon:yes stop_codon:yes gene_type:complete
MLVCTEDKAAAVVVEANQVQVLVLLVLRRQEYLFSPQVRVMERVELELLEPLALRVLESVVLEEQEVMVVAQQVFA